MADAKVFRLILIGKTGSGKSSTGNTILGRRAFDTSSSMYQCTEGCSTASTKLGSCTFEVMDTPGLFDTAASDHNFSNIASSLVAMAEPRPHAILFVINTGRYTEESYANYLQLKYLFGKDIAQSTIIIFTHADRLKDRNKSFSELLKKSNSSLHEMLEEVGSRYVLFDNTASDKRQVDKLLKIIKDLSQRRPFGSYHFEELKDKQEVERRLEEAREKARASLIGHSEKKAKRLEYQRKTESVISLEECIEQMTMRLKQERSQLESLRVQIEEEDIDVERRKKEVVRKAWQRETSQEVIEA